MTAVKTYDQAIQVLAKAHRQADPDTIEIRLVPDPSGKVIRLLEVSRALFTTNGEVLAIKFSPNPEIPFATIIAVVSPLEWTRLQAGEIELPEGWGSVEELRPLPAA